MLETPPAVCTKHLLVMYTLLLTNLAISKPPKGPRVVRIYGSKYPYAFGRVLFFYTVLFSHFFWFVALSQLHRIAIIPLHGEAAATKTRGCCYLSVFFVRRERV